MKRMITEIDAAKYLCLQPRTLQKWRWMGMGPIFCKLGEAVRYDMADLDNYIEGGLMQKTGRGRKLK